jgi:hypothetical protein
MGEGKGRRPHKLEADERRGKDREPFLVRIGHAGCNVFVAGPSRPLLSDIVFVSRSVSLGTLPCLIFFYLLCSLDYSLPGPDLISLSAS